MIWIGYIFDAVVGNIINGRGKVKVQGGWAIEFGFVDKEVQRLLIRTSLRKFFTFANRA